MFKLQDGREHLYQWDLDRYIIVEDNTIGEVHFCNRTSDCSLVVEVKDGLAAIPNIILQDARPIRVYAYVDDKFTLTEEQFAVKSRTKPADYVYTETEIKSYDYLEKKLNEIEEQGFSEETVAKAVEDYLADNSLGFASEEYVDNAISAIPTPDVSGQINAHNTSSTAHSDIRRAIPTKLSQLVNDKGYITEAPKTDLSNYYTKTQTDTAIKKAVDSIDIPEVDLTGYATEDYVTTKIAEAELGGGEGGSVDLSAYATKDYVDKALKDVDVDLTGYATETYVDDAIAAIPAPDLSGYAKVEDIPDTSEFISAIPDEYVTEFELEAKGYLTEHQSLKGLATEQYVKDAIDAIPEVDFTGYATEQFVNDAVAAIDIPEVPTKVSAFENDKGYLTEHQDISGKADKAHTHTLSEVTDYKAPDLTPYAKKTELPTKVSELANDKGYLTAIPSEYVTENELLNKTYATTSYVDSKHNLQQTAISNLTTQIATQGDLVTDTRNDVIDIKEDVEKLSNNKADKTAIPTKVSDLTNDKGYLTSIPSEYVTETELANQGFATTTYVDGEIDTVEEAIPTKLSQLENDAGYTKMRAEDYYTKEEINLANNIVVGTPFYRHFIKVKGVSSYFEEIRFDPIINTDSTPFTFAALSKYIWDNGGSIPVNGTCAASGEVASGLNAATLAMASHAYVKYENATEIYIRSSYISESATSAGVNINAAEDLDEVFDAHDVDAFEDVVVEIGETIIVTDAPSASRIFHFDASDAESDSYKYITDEEDEAATYIMNNDDYAVYLRDIYGKPYYPAIVLKKETTDTADYIYLLRCAITPEEVRSGSNIEYYAITLRRMAGLSIWGMKRSSTKYSTAVASKNYVDTAIANAALEGVDIDLTNYYTKEETDTAISDAIANIDIPEGGGGSGDPLYCHNVKIGDNVNVAPIYTTSAEPFTYSTLVEYTWNNGGTIPATGANGDAVYYEFVVEAADDEYTIVYALDISSKGSSITTITATSTITDTVVKVADTISTGGGGSADLSNYYNKTETDAAIATAVGNISIPDVSNLADKEHTHSISDITDYVAPDLSGYAKTSDIPDTSSFTTMAAVEAKGYQTAAQVTALINSALGVIENGTY